MRREMLTQDSGIREAILYCAYRQIWGAEVTETNFSGTSTKSMY